MGILLVLLPTEVDLGGSKVISLEWASGIALGLMLVSHTLAFLFSYVAKHNYRSAPILRLMFYPYVRGSWLFVGICAAVYVANRQAQEQQLWFIVSIVAMKLVLDCLSLQRELRVAPFHPLSRNADTHSLSPESQT